MICGTRVNKDAEAVTSRRASIISHVQEILLGQAASLPSDTESFCGRTDSSSTTQQHCHSTILNALHQGIPSCSNASVSLVLSNYRGSFRTFGESLRDVDLFTPKDKCWVDGAAGYLASAHTSCREICNMQQVFLDAIVATPVTQAHERHLEGQGMKTGLYCWAEGSSNMQPMSKLGDPSLITKPPEAFWRERALRLHHSHC